MYTRRLDYTSCRRARLDYPQKDKGLGMPIIGTPGTPRTKLKCVCKCIKCKCVFSLWKSECVAKTGGVVIKCPHCGRSILLQDEDFYISKDTYEDARRAIIKEKGGEYAKTVCVDARRQ
jgi:hypothetical protein